MVGPESMKIDNVRMINVGQHFEHILQLVLLETVQLKFLFLVQGTATNNVEYMSPPCHFYSIPVFPVYRIL